MPKVLVLFAHPRLEKSRSNRALLRHMPAHASLTTRDLYELYPDMNVDIAKEQALLLAHDIIVWHHPIYWYSAPPLLKQWIDLVLTFGWAYGPGGNALHGKVVMQAVTTGGAVEAYSANGFHGSTLQEFLLPFKRTSTLCGMTWLPPFVVHGSNSVSDGELEHSAMRYGALLVALAQGRVSPGMFTGLERANDVEFDTTVA
ncbi:MAG: NAD(P)H-dependent oxidoreductase [Flavobacteriales bacterium]